jgi:hypothetical protein
MFHSFVGLFALFTRDGRYFFKPTAPPKFLDDGSDVGSPRRSLNEIALSVDLSTVAVGGPYRCTNARYALGEAHHSSFPAPPARRFFS